jgi:hypothetical protein
VKPTISLHPATSVKVHRAAKVVGHMSGDRSSTLVGIKQFVFLPKFQTASGGTQSAVQTKGLTLSPEVKRSKPEDDHSPASTSKIRNRWSYTSASPICLNSVKKVYSTFPYVCIMWRCSMQATVKKDRYSAYGARITPWRCSDSPHSVADTLKTHLLPRTTVASQRSLSAVRKALPSTAGRSAVKS